MTDLTFERFAQTLGGRLGVEVPEPVAPSIELYDQLGLDSFQAFEMLIIIENMAENMVPPMEIPALFTLGDAYSYYLDLRAIALAESEL